MSKPLRIGQVATAAGVRAQTLRYYERRGLLAAPRRTSSGYREYSADAIRRVLFIRRAQTMGFTLDEIRVLLSLRIREPRRCDSVKKSAKVVRERVRERLADLERMNEVLGRLILACDRHDVTDDCPILAALEPGQVS